MTDRTLLDALEPIDPRTQVDRIPGIDAPCPQDLGEKTCRYPFCKCYSRDTCLQNEEAA